MSKNKIYEALHNVQKTIHKEGIGKDGHNSFNNYDYRTIDAVIESFSKPFRINKILTAVQPDLEIVTKAFDGGITMTKISGTLRFISCEDGSYQDVMYAGQAKSKQGKDLEAAKSFAYKTALLTTFCVPFSEGEPEEEYNEVEQKKEIKNEKTNEFVPVKSSGDSFLAEMEEADESEYAAIIENYTKAANLSSDKETLKVISIKTEELKQKYKKLENA
tara:strand:- start:3275 stop:3928 length:654 start_codon:yes stop_codon:yes gene_type:complete